MGHLGDSKVIKVVIALSVAVLVAGGVWIYSIVTAINSVDFSGPDVGNNHSQMLACTGAQMAVKQRLTGGARAVFPHCGSVPVVGNDREFIVRSYFDLADPSGVIRRHPTVVNVTHRPDDQWLTLITKMD